VSVVTAPELVRREVLRREVGEAYRDTFAVGAELGDVVPPGWEGLHFPFDVPLAGLRPDGSPDRDGLLPSVALPRRMYAGEDTVFHRPLGYGVEVEQRVRLGQVAEKTGRSGRLLFADLERDYLVAGEVAVRSTWHDVFLEAAPPAAGPVPDETEWRWREPLRLDSRQLFRFSALTFNTHRVHYDRDWARGVEGLPDLLVHGPLLRILLLDLAGRVAPGHRLARASVRIHGPVYVDTDVQLVGRGAGRSLELAVLGGAGDRLATADVTTTEPRP
jgi:3-methylfumaryl-CoA hydratase